MPAHNAAPFIGAAIESLTAQTTGSWELIVADDGSTDDTAAIAGRYADADSRIKVVSLPAPTGNPCAARARALRHASAPWIFPLDADDLVEPDFLSRLLDRQKETGADAVLCELWRFDVNPDGAVPFLPLGDLDTSAVYTGAQTLPMTLDGWTIPANGLFSREAYAAAGADALADAPGNPYADELLGRRLLHGCARVAFAPARYLYRMHGGSVTHAPDARRLGYLDTDRTLVDFVRGVYGAESDVYALAQMHLYHALAGAMLSQRRFPRIARSEVRRTLSRAYAAVDFDIVRRRQGGVISRIMRSGFRPAAAILNIYGYVRRQA